MSMRPCSICKLLFGIYTLASPASASTAATSGVSFITLGDWGGASLSDNPDGQTYVKNVRDVASQMAKTASKRDTQFIINTGDNFYWCGIQNTSDFQVDVDFVQPYRDIPKNIKWYSVLGNHEYGYNVSAQIDLANVHSNWVMDARYYSRRVPLPYTNNSHHPTKQVRTYVTMILLDTSPCISEYRSENKNGWDPCGDEYTTCALDGGKGIFEGECKFHEQIISQDCNAQFTWFENELKKVPSNDWLVVVGHHPADEIDAPGTDFVGVMQKHPRGAHNGVDLYINGHAHTLTHYSIDNKGAYITSGAGALVTSPRTGKEAQRPAADLTDAKIRTYNKTMGHIVELSKRGKHKYNKIWNGRVSGFTISTFSDDYRTLTTDFIGVDGNILHSFKIQKNDLFIKH